MKSKITGTQINAFANNLNKGALPDYFGDKYYPPELYTRKTVNGQFVAKKYNSILQIIEDTKATVKIEDTCIVIQYDKGQAKIDRDILTDTFLLPILTQTA